MNDVMLRFELMCRDGRMRCRRVAKVVWMLRMLVKAQQKKSDTNLLKAKSER